MSGAAKWRVMFQTEAPMEKILRVLSARWKCEKKDIEKSKN